MYKSPFGQPEGLGKRLAYWANQLSHDRKYPWMGCGLIDDLKCAAKLQGVDFDTLYSDQPASHNWPSEEIMAPKAVEFDL